jgi:D-sedoheptulose 7-phosphate isomerase
VTGGVGGVGGVEKIRESLNGLAELAGRVAAEQAEEIAAIADRYETTLRGGGTLFFAGNGGSAADAQHLATEYVVRYQTNRPAMRALALTTDTSLLTACANDMGFDEVFARQVEALAEPGDLLVLHSTSGESPNVIRAAQSAKARGVSVVALLGKGGGHLKELADVSLVVPADDTAHIQELHLAIEHVICDLVEERLKG